MLRPPKTALYREDVFRNVNGLDNDDFPKTCHKGMARYVVCQGGSAPSGLRARIPAGSGMGAFIFRGCRHSELIGTGSEPVATWIPVDSHLQSGDTRLNFSRSWLTHHVSSRQTTRFRRAFLVFF